MGSTHVISPPQVNPETGKPSGSKMLDWSTEERVQAVPDGIWPGLSSAKGLDQTFVGRTDELALLRQRHSRDPRNVDSGLPPDEQSFITVITNAPGVGKSALIEKLEAEHEESGGYSLRLTAGQLRNHKRLQRALQLSEPAQEAAILRDARFVDSVKRALEAVTDAPQAAARAVFSFVVRGAEELGRVAPEEPATDTHARIVHALAKHQANLDATSMLRIMGRAAGGRVLIIVDEAQALGAMTGSKTADLLQELGDPGHRSRLRLGSGGVVLAGLPDAIQRLRELHKSRAYNLHLEPLPPTDVKHLLTIAVRTGDPKGALGIPQQNRIATALAADFGGWTHHAHAAAFATAHILSNITRKGHQHMPDAQQLLEWIRTNAALGTCQLYDQTVELARGIIGLDGVAAAAKSMQTQGHVPGLQLNAAMAAQRALKIGDPVEKMDDSEGLQALLHAGLVARERGAGGGTEDRLIIPIPSLTDYLVATNGRAMRRNLIERLTRWSRLDMRTELNWAKYESNDS